MQRATFSCNAEQHGIHSNFAHQHIVVIYNLQLNILHRQDCKRGEKEPIFI